MQKAWGILALSALAAWGDQFNNKIILVGDKGASLGGAFTGLADDATATFYNPAGLTQIKNIKLNVSAQIVQFQKQEIQIADGSIIPYNSFNFSPSITTFSQRMGKWAYGFSVVTPQNDLFSGEQSIAGAYRDTSINQPCYENPGFTPCYTKLNLNYYDVSKTTLIGPSLALKFSDNISLGVTLYGIYYTELEKTSYGGWEANYVGNDTTDLARFHENNVVRNVNSIGLGVTGSFGILVRMDQGFSFGVKANPGSMLWVGRNEEQRVEEFLNERLVDGIPDTSIKTLSTVYNLDRQVRHTEVTAPSLSLGISWQPWSRLMLTAQTDYLLGSLYSYTGFSPGGPKDSIPRSGFEYSIAEERHYTIEKKAVVNFSGGADLRLTKEYSLTAGGFTDFSQGPYDDRPASWNRRIDYFGFAGSLGIDKEYTQSRFGASAAWGQASISHFQWTKSAGGQPVLATEQVPGSKTIRIARPRRSFDAFNLGVFLSSTLKI